MPAWDGLKQIGQFAKPNNAKLLRRAGVIGNPLGPVALARNFPRLIVRGPSLGIIVAMNGFTLRNKSALIDAEGTLTWSDLDRRSNRAARMLLENGVKPGERIALLLRNGREMVDLLLGAQKVGIVACPLNTWAKPKELTSTLESSDAQLLVYDVRHARQMKEADTRGVRSLFVGSESEAIPGSEALDEVLAGYSDRALPAITRDRGSPRIVIHTSGTTGTPKGAARNASKNGIGALADIISVVPYSRDDIVVVPSPMFHSFGLATMSFVAGLGATMVLPDRFEPELTLELIDKHKATAVSLVPVMIRRIVSLPDEVKARYDLSSLRILMASGSLLSEDLRHEAIALFGDVIYDLYGSTEVGWVTIATPEDMRERPGSVGRPVRGVEVLVFDDKGRRLPQGETGELYIKSDISFEGYTNAAARDEREGHMSIGDLGHLDEDGYVYVESRADDMVVVGGENVYPIEVEQVIEAMEGVREVYVFGIPDPEFVHVLAAAVVGSTSAEEVTAVCTRDLASYKVPKRVLVLGELPRTSTGKVLKRDLLESINSNDG